ncbi:hypothetical protein F5Y04DRAFT_183013 [Hypomontagnella monticulosa]|nr:hypothetical protein F5Y04DRAFT_183013 [Hypomontagnella monticulosa]
MSALTNHTRDHHGQISILTLGPDVTLKLMEAMRPSDIANLARTCKFFKEIFLKYHRSIMTTVLKNLPEFEILMHVFTAMYNEIQPHLMLRPRVVYLYNGRAMEKLMDTTGSSQTTTAVKKIVLDIHDISELWCMAQTIDWWVEYFPCLRWRNLPDERRCLRMNEEVRLRNAVAHWWLYARHHHGYFGRGRHALHPMRWSDDTRLQIVRRMSTSEVRELQDLWRFVKETVSMDLCSSPERVCACRGTTFDLVPWAADEGGNRHARIVRTYMKLDPAQLRYFLKTYSYWKKTFTIPAVKKSIENFAADTETLHLTLDKVLEERRILGQYEYGDVPQLGILDDDRVNDRTAARWTVDAWPTGQMPKHIKISDLPADLTLFVMSGDDGSGSRYTG